MVRASAKLMGFASLLLAVTPALGEPVGQTRYAFYPVTGKSAVAIYRSLVKNGPRFGEGKAYATTTAVARQFGKLVPQNGCRIEKYALRVNFTVTLPQLRGANALDGTTRSEWQSFIGYLKQHEGMHRKIWMACAARHEVVMRSAHAASCAELNRLIQSSWNRVTASCAGEHEKLDDEAQRILIRQQSFVQHAIREAERTGDTQALAVPKNHRKTHRR